MFLRVNTRTATNEFLYNIQVTVSRCQPQWGPAFVTLRVHDGAILDQQPHDTHVSEA
jgi:hypothetical protein